LLIPSTQQHLAVGWAAGEHPAVKKLSDEVMAWHDYLSGARCKGLACGPADATATPSSLLQKNSVWSILLVLAYPDCPGKRPLNECHCCCNPIRSNIKIVVT